MSNFDTLFLDRDGVINKKIEDSYVRDSSEFIFIDGALSAIAKLTLIFKRILIVTNQQGVGKGIMSHLDLKILHEYMLREINQHKGNIAKIYYCPHLIKDNCSCRKPKPGMIKDALLDFPDIVIESSFLVGDSDSDIIAGKTLGLQTIKVDNNYTLSRWTYDFFK